MAGEPMAVLHDSFLIGLVICCDRFVIMTGLFYINHLRIIITSSIVYSDVKASEHLFIIIHHRWSTLVSKLHHHHCKEAQRLEQFSSSKHCDLQCWYCYSAGCRACRLKLTLQLEQPSIKIYRRHSVLRPWRYCWYCFSIFRKKRLSYVLIFFFLHRVDYCSSMISVFQCINNSHPV